MNTSWQHLIYLRLWHSAETGNLGRHFGFKKGFWEGRNPNGVDAERMEPTSAAVGLLPTKEVTVLRGHEGAVLAVRFNKDGKYCLSCGKDRTLRLWNPYKGVHIKTYSGHARDVRDVAVSK
jgi:WD40 repeat protein